MQEWIIKQRGYDKELVASLGNRYLIGNGYLGVRGTLEEYEADKLPAINLAGVYDQVGDGWREPVNAPNGCYSYLRVDSAMYKIGEQEPISHEMTLDYRYGVFSRKTTWRTTRGMITLETERFASMEDVHRIGMRFTITADFHADVELVTGIDTRVWDLNGPHLEEITCQAQGEALLVQARTHEQQIPVVVADSVWSDYPKEMKQIITEDRAVHRIFFITRPGIPCRIEKWVGIYTGKDTLEPAKAALECTAAGLAEGFEKGLAAHKACWDQLWSRSQVNITGDAKAMEALRYSLYHLHSIAPRHTDSLSIPARGLSGQTYKGAVFWDTELFMLDFFLMTDPDTARTLMKYRIDTLQGALDKAAHYGFDGAFYAWESQEGGYDACTDYNVTDVFTGRPVRTYFKDKQVHISAAVVYGILRYTEWTGDESLLDEAGLRTIIECAKFYYSLLLHPLGKSHYDIRDVIGPDEYHERVNNNGYTNRMAKFTMEKAAELVQKAMAEGTLPEGYDGEVLFAQFQDGAEKLYLPEPATDKEHKNVLEQFEGYFELENASLAEVKSRLLHEKEYWGGANGVASHTQIIKQADVVTWLNLFSWEHSYEVLKANWEYYEPRTEHGSSLSAGMYAMLACKIGQPDRAYPFFMKSARADLVTGGKEWAGLVYIGGTHPAAAGAAYMTAIEGFAGLSVENGKLVCKPSLPHGWEAMSFPICYRGQAYEVKIQGEEGWVTAL